MNDQTDLVDQLISVLMQRFSHHYSPKNAALAYIAQMAKSYIPEESLKFHIDYNEKQLIVETLKS